MSTNHDILAYAVATEAVRRVRIGVPPWLALLSTTAYITSSRAWPVPDFVLVDSNNIAVAAEFKPPQQTKREYLTGLGQAVAYTRDFDYGLLIIPDIADDGYPIAQHVVSILQQAPWAQSPVGVISYNPALFSPSNPHFTEAHFFSKRASRPVAPAALDSSFYAKWREISPEEMFALLSHSYDEVRRPSTPTGTIRDRAFLRLWGDIQAHRLHHWGGGVRNYGTTIQIRTGVNKNYRNFLYHVGWTESDGSLTKEGLEVFHVGTLYGANSRPFLDALSRSVLLEGKHLILFNAIAEYQDLVRPFPAEQIWLEGLENYLYTKGLLKRNPARAAAAIAGSARAFFKAEKQLWRNLELIKPRGARVFHPGRGLIFNWSRITDLVQ